MSGGLNVIARTQKIIVEPAAASVAVTNVGQPGPAGPQGRPGPPGPGGPGTTPEWGRFGVIAGSFGAAQATVALTRQGASDGMILADPYRIKVPNPGMYLIHASMTAQGVGNSWVILDIIHARANDALVNSCQVVGGTSSNGEFNCLSNALIYNMLAGDTVRCVVTALVEGTKMDDRSWVAITELPSNIGPTVVPPGGNTGQILAKLSNADYDVGWVDPS